MSNIIYTDNYTSSGHILTDEMPPTWIIVGAQKIVENITGANYCDNWEELLAIAEARLEILKAKDRLSKLEKGDLSSLEWSMGVIRRLIRLKVSFKPILSRFVPKPTF